MSAGLAEAAAPGQQFRTAYREQFFCAQPHRVEARPVAVAVTHGEVDFLAREVDVMQRRGHAQVDTGMRLGKMTEPVHQPFGGKIRRGADRQNAGVLPLEQPLGADGDAIQRVPHDGEIVAARLGDNETLALAVEKLDGELGFERLDLMTHRALRDAKLFRRARKTLMPRGGLEGLQGVQRWQARAHRTTS